MTKVIEVIVSPTGETKIQTKGFSGSDCQNATRLLEAALGQPQREQLTSEFYAGQRTECGNQLRQ